jgi:hypothetical protein
MTRYRMIPVVGLLTFEAAAVTVLHWLGAAGGLGSGVLVSGVAPVEDIVMAAARLAASAVAWWLLVTTSLCVAARIARLPSALRAAEWAALPAVRRLVERSLVATLSLSAVAGVMPPGATHGVTAAASAAVPEPALLVPGVEGGVVVPPGAQALGLAVTVPPGGAIREGAALPREHTVARGEHLWGLATEVVATATGRAAADVEPGEVAAYWARLIEANPANLRSGDPDLVYPGERLRLPPLLG